MRERGKKGGGTGAGSEVEGGGRPRHKERFRDKGIREIFLYMGRIGDLHLRPWNWWLCQKSEIALQLEASGPPDGRRNRDLRSPRSKLHSSLSSFIPDPVGYCGSYPWCDVTKRINGQI